MLPCDPPSPFGSYTLSGDPTFPFSAFCPQGFHCSGNTQVFLQCCDHLLERDVPRDATQAELSAIFQSLLQECRQYQSECQDPPTDPLPGPGPPVDPVTLYYNRTVTCYASCPDATTFSYTTPAGLFISTSQAASDQAAFNYACVQARRLRRCPPEGSLDMALDQAVYDPVRDVIFGVRGGFIFEFSNAGVPTSNRARYVVPDFSDASIAYDSVTDRLYALYWNDPSGDPTNAAATGIYKINPATLGVEAHFDLNALGSVDPANDDFRGRLIARGGVLYGQLSGNSTVSFNCDTAGTTVLSNGFGTASGWQGLEINGTELWVGEPNGIGQHLLFLDAATMNFIATVNLGIGAWDVAINTTNGRGYCTTRSPVIKRVSAAHAVLSNLTLPNPSAAPFCIRYNAVDNKIYCPDETTNSVYVIDGTTEAITVKAISGTNPSPFDMVFTPTKKFAVCHGIQGLIEVV